jgi:membrane-associated phospholipid phosphatase
VLDARRQLTPAQREAAWFWNLDAGSVTPAGVWLQLALQALTERPDIGTPARLELLAAMGMAMHDAFIHCWRIKLRDWSERPVTAIRRTLDPSFDPLLVTPGFPGYVSGHATVSAAAAEVLAQHLPGAQAHWRARAEEAAMSRLWGGIHFRSDNEHGARLGRSVGQAVLAHAERLV